MSRRLPLVCLTLVFTFVLVSHAFAQLQVTMKVPRRLFMAYEPVIATVSITNLTGGDVALADDGPRKWFSFQISTENDRLVPPRNLDYQLDPLTIPNGQTVKRSVNLVNLYPITDFGAYRVRASVHLNEIDRYFSSQPVVIEISEGKVMWQQSVGVPGGDKEGGSGYRLYELLAFRQIKDNMLYVRVRDKDAGIIYATYPLGRLITGDEPQIQLDDQNHLHVFQLVGAKAFVYTRIGLDGEWLGQVAYNEVKTRPHLKKFAGGKVDVVGGEMDAPVAQPVGAPAPPKLSDRPPGMPR